MTGVVASGFVALLVFLGGLFAWGRDLPSVSDLDVLEFSGQSRVFDREGQLIGTLTPSLSNGSRVNRTLLRLDQVSPFLRDAVVTSEDRRFYNHHGIDFLGIARGLWRGLRGDLEGGSTLTQQLVKNTLLADLEGARTAERKFKEAILAVQVDRNFNKDEILGAYLNVIYWGSGGRSDIIGAATASRSYLQKDARQLNLAESVYLATLIPSPGRYFNYQGYRPLMRSLLERMVEDGRVTRAQAEAAWRFPLQPAGWQVRYDAQGNIVSASLVDKSAKNRNTPLPAGRAHLHFLQAVERELIRLYGRKAVYSGTGLKVYTTMDAQAQAGAERASRNARLPAGATLGIALVQPDTGEVLALVGQKLEGTLVGEWNNATQARRQVGSAIKPLLYTLAIEKGRQQYDTVLDAPLEGDYQPKNYNGRFLGTPVTLRYALNHSLNLPTVRLGQDVGVRTLERKLADLGLPVPSDAGLSLAIGTLEASPLQLASAYASFANGGEWHEPRVLRRVVSPDGRDLPLPGYASRRVWDTQTAFLGLDMLRGVVGDLGQGQGGLAWRARIPGWDVGGKTGTTNDVKDLWFAGVTPGVAGAVWVGRQEGGAMPENAYSGDIAAPVWQEAVAGAVARQTPRVFKAPEGVAFQLVRGVRMAVKADSPGLAAGVRRFFERPAASQPERKPSERAPAPALREAPIPQTAPAPPQVPTEPSGLPQPEDLQPSVPRSEVPGDRMPGDPASGDAVPSATPPVETAPPAAVDTPPDSVPVPPDLQPLPEVVPPVAEPAPDTLTPEPSFPPDDQQFTAPEEPQGFEPEDRTY